VRARVFGHDRHGSGEERRDAGADASDWRRRRRRNWLVLQRDQRESDDTDALRLELLRVSRVHIVAAHWDLARFYAALL
jgi:hypothetical protein